MAIFGRKPWVKSFGKLSIFSLFELFVFSLERRFFVLEYRKRHFPGLNCLKKKSWKNGYFLTKTMGYPIWKNVNFPTFWTSCFYSLERVFFCSRISEKNFSWPILSKKKLPFLAIFGRKPWVNSFGKLSIFNLFVFIA